MAEDVTFDCLQFSNYAGLIKLELTILGNGEGANFVMDEYPFELSIAIQGYGKVGSMHTSEWDTHPSMEVLVEGTGITNVERTNWVAWSQIGAANFEINRTNDAGYMPMKWAGYVYQILPLGKNGVIYGSGGVTMMYPVSQPMPTFGFAEVVNHGIMWQGAAAGSEKIHYFITSDGTLYRLTSEGPEKLGFKEFLKDLRYPVLMYDHVTDRLYISTEMTGFIFAHNALGGWLDGVTGVMWLDDQWVGVSPRLLVAPNAELITNVMDLGSRGRKDIEGLTLGCESDLPLEVCIDYRYDKSRQFRRSPWTRVSPDGYARVKVSALDFRIRIRNRNHAMFRLHYMNVLVKFADKRFRRSVGGGQMQ